LILSRRENTKGKRKSGGKSELKNEARAGLTGAADATQEIDTLRCVPRAMREGDSLPFGKGTYKNRECTHFERFIFVWCGVLARFWAGG